MKNNKTVTGIILCAGNSIRFGQDKNKNLFEISNKPILIYSLENFEKNKYIDDIIIAVREEDKKDIENIIKTVIPIKHIKLIIGGKTRKESVYNCIKNTNSDIVIIHDGARPYIKQEYINNCIEEMDIFNGVAIAVKSKDTIKITDEKGIVKSTTDRKNTWIIQTPQCFDRKILKSCHEKQKDDESITDDCMLLERNNQKIKLIEGDYQNIKVTTYEDIYVIKQFMCQ